MASLATLEREIEKQDEQLSERRVQSAAESEHADRIADNYRKLIFAGAAEMQSEEAQRATAEAVVLEAPAAEANASERFADYTPIAAPAAHRHLLFENLTYKEGELLDGNEPAGELSVATESESEEDATPTSRTMETLRHNVQQSETAAVYKTSFFASISPKAKIAMLVVAVAAFVILALVFINVAILNSLDAGIAAREAELNELKSRSYELTAEIDRITDPENIDAWAQANGMTQASGLAQA